MENSERHQIVVVPVRVGPGGVPCLTVCRRPDGARTGVAFTSLLTFQRVMGEKHLHVTMSLTALRTVLAGIEIRAIQVDPEARVLPAPRLRAVS